MEKLIEAFTKFPYLKTLLISLGLIVLYFIVKKIIFYKIKKSKLSQLEKTFQKKKTTGYLRIALIIILFAFWFAHLQVLFVSLIAVAAAIVIAFKEVIMCLTGGLLIRSSRPFTSSQRIEIGDMRGFVLESGLLVTKLLEIGPEKNSQQTTGDIITLPNSMMLASPVKNESYFKEYSIKTFQFKIEQLDLVEQFEKELIEKAKNICEPYIENAKKSISRFCEKEGIAIPSIAPRTKLLLDSKDRDFIVLIKVPVINVSIADMEQAFNRFYLNWRLQNNDTRVSKDKEE